MGIFGKKFDELIREYDRLSRGYILNQLDLRTLLKKQRKILMEAEKKVKTDEQRFVLNDCLSDFKKTLDRARKYDKAL